ncbi:MAG: cyclic pyranopterin monophosphate synthase MoaC [Thermoleophilia bacterium]|nr:MAG: cyclic pyranopterin monophosphate synthase MoaC [Thermoleophilia bacterium]
MTDVRMIDVGAKAVTRRRALARCEVQMSDEALAKIEDGTVAKGDVFATARVAGIAAAKKTPDLLPLCHPLMLDHVRVDLAVDRSAGCVRIEAECALDGRTGVEMEALVSVATAALCVHDMLKSTDPEIRIDGIALWEKDGGKSGAWRRSGA